MAGRNRLDGRSQLGVNVELTITLGGLALAAILGLVATMYRMADAARRQQEELSALVRLFSHQSHSISEEYLRSRQMELDAGRNEPTKAPRPANDRWINPPETQADLIASLERQ